MSNVETNVSTLMSADVTKNRSMEFVDGWTVEQTLGEGAFGEVKLLLNRTTGEAVAMKIIDTEKHADAKVSVRKEVCIHRSLVDAQIIRFFGHRREENLEYIFLEYASGGELFDRIEPDLGMSTWEAQKYFKQLIAGVERALEKRCGTLPYVAPEVLIRPYFAEPADLWACGVILVAMLCGELPWDEPTSTCSDYMAWKNRNYTHRTPWVKMDNMALSLAKRILVPIPSSRITIAQIKCHRWITKKVRKEIGSTRSWDSPPTGMACSKRVCTGSHLSPVCITEEGHSRLCSSQPEPNHSANELVLADGDARVAFCFSQPAHMDDLFLSSQINYTQQTHSSQNTFQKLVRRMTRFFVRTSCEEAVATLCDLLEKQSYVVKRNTAHMLTISCLDKRKMQLVFKANVLAMDGKTLLDFRLSKGCGLEFKRRFVKIKQSLGDIVLMGLVMWPIAVATNSIP